MADHADATSTRSTRKWFPTLPDDLLTYYVIFAILMILLLVTVLAARVHLGPLNLTVALTIACIKAVLVVLYFMHVKQASWLTWVFAGAAFLWLGIMLVLTFGDYATRPPSPFMPQYQAPVAAHRAEGSLAPNSRRE